jgi:xanthine dehydrogenase small subunit
MRDYLLVHINGKPHRIGPQQAFTTLSRFLRYDERLTGTKIVCEEGDCGACTVLVGRRENGSLRYRPVNSCIQFLFQLDCASVVTVEGLSAEGELTPIQDAMVRCHGAQCGYCTPGFVMALAGLCEDRKAPSRADAEAAITGNLCRCTGYEPIIRAAVETEGQPRIADLHPDGPILEAIAPVEREPVQFERFCKPADLQAAIAWRAANPGSVIVQGGTDFGVWVTKRGFEAPAVLSLDGIAGLDEISADGTAMIIGGRVSLSRFEEAVGQHIPEARGVMDRFGSPQIKNSGTLAGNIANGSPIADTLPFLFVMNAVLELSGVRGTRSVPIQEFYLGYKKLDLQPDEIITRIVLPLPSRTEVLRLYKISKRTHLDIATFTAAFRMTRTDGRIDSMRIAYGGVGPVVLRLSRTERFLEGRRFERATFEEAAETAVSEVTPISDVRGSRDYRLQLSANILPRFYYDAAEAS